MATPGEQAEAESETEWVVSWNEGGIVPYRTRDEAVGVARIYGLGTAASKVSVLRRTVTTTYGPWIADDA